jgi:aerobic-type carbon monoxide dehydrogenase small subunit (CoxS/CutS family)
MRVDFTLNGSARSLEADPRRSLLEVLREDLDLTGTKYGCGEGACRACTVLIDGVATVSCLTPVGEVQGKTVVTIEGLASGASLHPVQQAFLEAGAMQCGYCIPGMILSTVGLLAKTPSPSDQEIVAALNGNLCRCCTYPNILEAARTAAGRRSSER